MYSCECCDVRSAPVRELSAQIQEALDSRREANIWELFELKRFMFEAGRRILSPYCEQL